MGFDKEVTVQIPWARLAFAVAFYEAQGFLYREVPWMVGEGPTSATAPTDRPYLIAALEGRFWGCPVGSAEQSFLELLFRDQLSKGRWVTLTPCFRNDEPDELHFTHFMKVELFDNSSPDEEGLERVIASAEEFFSQYLVTTRIQTGDRSYDLLSPDGIELGSYGIRSWGSFQWVYGTGLAEPRLSQAHKKVQR